MVPGAPESRVAGVTMLVPSQKCPCLLTLTEKGLVRAQEGGTEGPQGPGACDTYADSQTCTASPTLTGLSGAHGQEGLLRCHHLGHRSKPPCSGMSAPKPQWLGLAWCGHARGQVPALTSAPWTQFPHL